MSEYQYYEFVAVDRRLSAAERAELRAVSSRGEISASRFANHYEWGDLKADPGDWMRRYFDAFVYTANWCSCRLSLRVPLITFQRAALEPFTTGGGVTSEATDKHWIFHWALDESEDYDRFSEDDGGDWMHRLLPLRAELMRGDLRPLYLGWLAGVCRGQLPADEVEPEVPDGLAELSPPQQALVEFLEIDADMLAAAATESAPHSSLDIVETGCIAAWLEEWSRDEMASMLTLIALGQGIEAERHVVSRYVAWLKLRQATYLAQARRTVDVVWNLADSIRAQREQREAEQLAKRLAVQRQQREAHLRQLMAEVNAHWESVEVLVKRGHGSYDQALSLLVDLAEGYSLTASHAAFQSLLKQFVLRHKTRVAFLRRMSEKGLSAA